MLVKVAVLPPSPSVSCTRPLDGLQDEGVWQFWWQVGVTSVAPRYSTWCFDICGAATVYITNLHPLCGALNIKCIA